MLVFKIQAKVRVKKFNLFQLIIFSGVSQPIQTGTPCMCNLIHFEYILKVH